MTEKERAGEGTGGCGLPLILLWGLQGAIDDGTITRAQALELLKTGGPPRAVEADAR